MCPQLGAAIIGDRRGDLGWVVPTDARVERSMNRIDADIRSIALREYVWSP